MSWLYVFLGFSALIILHEAGHFFAAKATGMRVERFFLFFGPTLFSIKRGETEYGVKSIPLGGYVKISGMNPDDKLPPGEEHRGYYEQPVWKRIFVIGAGPAVNIVLAFVVFFFVFLAAGEKATQTVGEIVPKSPAAATLKEGDEIVAVNGRRYSDLSLASRLEKFREEIAAHRCPGRQTDGCRAATPVRITVGRNGTLKTIAVRPEYESSLGHTRLGFLYRAVPADFGVVESSDEALGAMWKVTSGTATVFSKLWSEKHRKEVSGVVGVSDVAHETIEKFGATQALILLALVSLSLGLINLFPFLPLDGGHIFWSLVEKVRGRPVAFQTMERAGAVGFVLVIMLAVLGLS
ncbi:MAG TPA: site-2 protease family protein, partial [Solirubrobacterales bacterium]|nr:site-2 protease family protein [Solirubrobacterales bacterium]